MATAKRYYWMKLKESFMTSDTIDYFMSQPDGANYVVLYQMLCLKTINTGGRLSRQIGEIIIPYDVEKIQRDCKWFSIDTVRIALKLFQAVGLVYEDVDGTLVLSDHMNLVGSESDSAARVRESRTKKKATALLQCNNNVTHDDVTEGEQMANIVTPDIDIRDRDKILDIDIRNQSEEEELSLSAGEPPAPEPSPMKEDYTETYKAVVSYLNEKAGTKYKHTSSKTQTAIHARLADGFSLDDFKTVIDKKSKEWIGTEFEKYLRPETLFGPKFEGYLNGKQTERTGSNANAQNNGNTGGTRRYGKYV